MHSAWQASKYWTSQGMSVESFGLYVSCNGQWTLQVTCYNPALLSFVPVCLPFKIGFTWLTEITMLVQFEKLLTPSFWPCSQGQFYLVSYLQSSPEKQRPVMIILCPKLWGSTSQLPSRKCSYSAKVEAWVKPNSSALLQTSGQGLSCQSTNS